MICNFVLKAVAVLMGRTKRLRIRKHRTGDHPITKFQYVIACLDSREDHIKLVKSLHARGWSNETHLRIGNFPLTGRGIYTTKNLRENDLLIEMHTDALITINTIAVDSYFATLARRILVPFGIKINTQCLFAFYILYVKYHHRYTAYIDSIPPVFTVPYFCSDYELKGMSNEIQIKVESQRKIISSAYALLEHKLCMEYCACCNRPFVPELMNQSAFEWAFFAVNSRSVYLSPNVFKNILAISDCLNDSPNLALAPFLDLINHSSTAETIQTVQVTKTHALYQLYTKKPIKKYEQIFISYGALDNFKLITEYGFSLPNNKFDELSVEFDEVQTAMPPIPYKIQTFYKLHGIDQHLYLSRDHGISHNLLLIIYLNVELERDPNLIKSDAALNRIVYADSVQLNEQMKLLISKLLESKITKLTGYLNYFTKIKNSGTLSDCAWAYVNYLDDTVKWLEELLLMHRGPE